LALFGLWLCFSLAQTAHFYFYFEVPLHRSLEWGFRDWFVWFCLIVAVRLTLRRTTWTLSTDVRSIATLAIIAVACGWLQILVIISLDFLTAEPSRPFVEDVLHLYRKRWLQNLVVFGLLWIIIGQLLSKTRNVARVPDVDQRPERIRITADGGVHWLAIDDIHCVEVAGNYVCITTGDQSYIARSTLKQIEASLPQSRFLRISRSCLVNRLFIRSCARVARNRVEIRLVDDNTYAVGRTYWPSVRESLDF